MYQKLTYTFSHASFGTKLYKIIQVVEARQCYKWDLKHHFPFKLSSLKLWTKCHDSLVKNVHRNVVVCTFYLKRELRSNSLTVQFLKKNEITYRYKICSKLLCFGQIYKIRLPGAQRHKPLTIGKPFLKIGEAVEAGQRLNTCS